MKRFASLVPDRRLLTGVAMGVLVGVIGVSAVTAAAPSPLASTAAGSAAVGLSAPAAPLPSAPGAAAKPGFRLQALRALLRRNWRVDVTTTGEDGIHGGTLVRGNLTIGAGSVTVTMPDETTQGLAVTAETIVRSSAKAVDFSTLKNGDKALVLGTKNGDGTLTAGVIRLIPTGGAAETAP